MYGGIGLQTAKGSGTNGPRPAAPPVTYIVCMYACIYIYIHIRIHVHIILIIQYTYNYLYYDRDNLYTYIYIYMYIHMHISPVVKELVGFRQGAKVSKEANSSCTNVFELVSLRLMARRSENQPVLYKDI